MLCAVFAAGCTVGSESPAAVVTVTATPTPTAAESLEDLDASASPTVTPRPHLDPAADLSGQAAFLELLPSRDQMAGSVGGLWVFDPETYIGPGEAEADQARINREISLLIQPKRCRRAGPAAILGWTIDPSNESINIELKQGGATLSLNVEKYRSEQDARAEFSEWRHGFGSCRRFTGTAENHDNMRFAIEQLHSGSNSLTSVTRNIIGVGGVYFPMVATRVGSALVISRGMWVLRADGAKVDNPITLRMVRKAHRLVLHRLTNVHSGMPGDST